MSRRAGGYLTISEPGKPLVEIDTITCCHCQRIVPLNRADGTKLDPPAFCLACMAPQCASCASRDGCEAFERTVDKMEARDRLLRSMGVE